MSCCDFLAFVRWSTGEIMDTMTRVYLLGHLKSAGSRYSYGNADFFKKLLSNRYIWRGRAVVACQPHKLKVGGPNPSPVTNFRRNSVKGCQNALGES